MWIGDVTHVRIYEMAEVIEVVEVVEVDAVSEVSQSVVKPAELYGQATVPKLDS